MSEELAGYGIFEITGVIFAFIYIFLAIKEKRSCWIAAIISSLAYVPTFYVSRLYTESVLQLFFVVISMYAWVTWRKDSKNREIIICKWGFKSHLKIILVSLGTSVLLGVILKTYTNASFPFTDSAITVFSISTTFLQSKKVLHNWLYWVAIDSVAVIVYILKYLYLTAGLYAVYTMLAVKGYMEWKKSFNKVSNL